MATPTIPSDKQILNHIFDIAENFASMTNGIDDATETYSEFRGNMERLRKVYPRINEAVAVLCEVVEAIQEGSRTDDRNFTQVKFKDYPEVLRMVEMKKK